MTLKPHRMRETQTIATDDSVARCVCQSASLSVTHLCPAHKRLHGSKFCFELSNLGPKEHCIRAASRFTYGERLVGWPLPTSYNIITY